MEIINRDSSSKGALLVPPLDLSDLNTVPTSAASFSRRKPDWISYSTTLVLFFLFGLDPTVKRAQSFQMNVGVNCLGAFAFTKLLTPLLIKTAREAGSEPGSVRVVWFSSNMDFSGGVGAKRWLKDYEYEHRTGAKETMYGNSKTGQYLYGVELAKRYSEDGVNQ